MARILARHFKAGNGYYTWSGLRYVLYEYALQTASGQKKVEWDDLTKHSRDRISIEHIYPQTSTPDSFSDKKSPKFDGARKKTQARQP
jgi:hypothetical protein